MNFEAFTDWQNLVMARDKASRGKRGKGEVAAFEYRLEENLLDLQRELQTLRWRPGGYVHFFIHDPKRRLISAAPFRDRVVHHALCNVIEAEFERSFVQDSFANRMGKGNHRALDAAQQQAKRFPSVTEGFGFLGFRIFPERRRIKKRKGIQYQRHLKGLLRAYQAGLIADDSVLDSIMAWNNHAGYGNTIGLRKRVFRALPEPLAREARRRWRRTLIRRKADARKAMSSRSSRTLYSLS
ncbi:MAG: hypothetical protein ACU843_17320 [Gammaproteobacteria bacterium]